MKKLICAVTVLAVSSVQADTIFVDDDAPFGGDGLSWNTAYQFLQDALANAVAGTEIRVAQGVYLPDQDEAGNVTPGDRQATFQLVGGVALRGGYAGLGAVNPDERNVDGYPSILSGDLQADDQPGFTNYDDNACHVATGTFVGRTAVLDGFTVRAGSGEGSGCSAQGAGLYLKNAHPIVRDCVFAENLTTGQGGGLYNESSSPDVLQCRFVGNQAGAGGGLYCKWASPEIVDCIFVDNAAVGNSSGGMGGGAMVATLDSAPRMVNCLVIANTAATGGAIYCCCGSNTTVINSTFVANQATDVGGAIAVCCTGVLNLTNSILWQNVSELGNELAVVIGPNDIAATVSVSHCDVEGDMPLVYVEAPSELNWLAGNIDVDPAFMNGLLNVRLSPNSPCLDAGDNTAVPQGIDTDLDGNPRFVDDPETPDSGNGVPPIVDMGAYEFQPTLCPWDCADNDGIVSLTDFLQVIVEWNMVGSPCDVDGGGVGISDFLGLLANWGPCP